jgi:hypothetical protein
MSFFKKLTKTEIVIFSVLGIIMILSAYFGWTDEEYFNLTFAREDGAIEYATFVFLFLISLLQFYRLFSYGKNTKILWNISVFFLAILFLFGAGEEISWGQRIFDIQSGDFFSNNNLQKETNLHNLQIGDVKLNKLIFSQILTVVMALYLLLMPVLYRKYTWAKNLVDSFVVPVPQNTHILAFLINTLFIAILPNLSRKWEVYELFFAAIFWLIFLNPINKNLYARETRG